MFPNMQLKLKQCGTDYWPIWKCFRRCTSNTGKWWCSQVVLLPSLTWGWGAAAIIIAEETSIFVISRRTNSQHNTFATASITRKLLSPWHWRRENPKRLFTGNKKLHISWLGVLYSRLLWFIPFGHKHPVISLIFRELSAFYELLYSVPSEKKMTVTK